MRCDSTKCTGSLLTGVNDQIKPYNLMVKEAVDFINEFYTENKQ